MKKNVLLSLGIAIAASAVTAGVAYAAKNGSLKRTLDKASKHPLVAGAVDKIGDLKSRLANPANDDRQNAAAA